MALKYFTSIDPVSSTASLLVGDGVLLRTVHTFAAGARIGDLSTIGGRVYFNLKDSSGTSSLWTSDGTDQGTTQLDNSGVEAVHGLYSAGSALDLSGSVYFASGNGAHGTATGTDMVKGNAAEADCPTLRTSDTRQNGTADLPSMPPAENWTDVRSSGPSLHGTEGTAAATFQGVPDKTSFLAASTPSVATDVNDDGTSDLILQPFFGGPFIELEMRNSVIANVIQSTDTSNYYAAYTGDFNGDGTSDVVLESGYADIVDEIQNGAIIGSSTLSKNTGGFSLRGTGDFDGDGTSDIVLVGGNNNAVVEWGMKDGKVVSGETLSSNPGGYRVVGTGDFNGDGTDDIVLQNLNGPVVDWLMHDGVFQSGGTICANPNSFTVAATGDYNGDGTDDIAMKLNNKIVDWSMQDGKVAAAHTVLNNPAPFTVVP